MQEALEILRTFSIALLIALTVVAIPYVAFVLVTAPIRRQATIQLVISPICATVRQHIPIGTGLAIAAMSEPLRARRRLQGISRLVSQGRRLSEAMRMAFPECPGILVSLVEAGERAGQLPAAVQQVENYVQDNARLRQASVTSPLPYVLLIVAVAVFMNFVISLILAPKIVEIFRDYQLDPRIWISQSILPLQVMTRVLLIVFLVLLTFALVSMWLRIRPRQTPVPSGLSRAADWLRWHTPGLSKMEHGLGMATAFRAMEFCLQSGMNLHEAVGTAACLDINWNLRQKLKSLSTDLSRGVKPRDAVRTAAIGGIASVVLASTSTRRNLPQACRFASDFYASIVSRWWVLASNLAWPICTLLLACLIGSLVYSLFQPIVLLIDAVITSTGY